MRHFKEHPVRQGQRRAKPPKTAQVYQSLTHVTEDALVERSLQTNSQGFPPRLSLLKANLFKTGMALNRMRPSRPSRPISR